MASKSKAMKAAALLAVSSGLSAQVFAADLKSRNELIKKILSEQPSEFVSVGNVNKINGEASKDLISAKAYDKTYTRGYDKDAYDKTYTQYDKTTDGRIPDRALTEREQLILEKYSPEVGY